MQIEWINKRINQSVSTKQRPLTEQIKKKTKNKRWEQRSRTKKWGKKRVQYETIAPERMKVGKK